MTKIAHVSWWRYDKKNLASLNLYLYLPNFYFYPFLFRFEFRLIPVQDTQDYLSNFYFYPFLFRLIPVQDTQDYLSNFYFYPFLFRFLFLFKLFRTKSLACLIISNKSICIRILIEILSRSPTRQDSIHIQNLLGKSRTKKQVVRNFASLILGIDIDFDPVVDQAPLLFVTLTHDYSDLSIMGSDFPMLERISLFGCPADIISQALTLRLLRVRYCQHY